LPVAVIEQRDSTEVNVKGAIMNTRTHTQTFRGHNAQARAGAMKIALVLALPALALSGCYVIPMDRHGNPVYPVAAPAAPPPVYQTTAYPNGATPPVVYSGSALPAVLNVRLYPANDVATQTGMMTGTVTNLMSGKGRFQFDYRGELLSGEATRVSGDERRGVASAYGSRGTFVSCEYQMSSPLQGAGTCSFNNGAKYQAHIGG
jgi:hypothetical protein